MVQTPVNIFPIEFAFRKISLYFLYFRLVTILENYTVLFWVSKLNT